jgi:cellulose biosynthesis protein BcsQ
MRDSQLQQPKLLVIEPECILANELEDELRFTLNADVTVVSNLKLHHPLPARFDIAVLDCPPSMQVFATMFAVIGAHTSSYIITHTHDIVPGVIPHGLNTVFLVKPYRLEALVEAAKRLLHQNHIVG